MLTSPCRSASSVRAALAALGASVALLAAAPARAEVREAAPRPDDQFDVMNALAHRGLHDLRDERWNAYGQITLMGAYKAPFSAPYTNANGSNGSLSPRAEGSYTGTATIYLGVRLWPGAEAYFVPEVVAERPLSELHGLGGAIHNFELQKTGALTPQVYRSRAYVRQTIGLGGATVERPSDPMSLGATVAARRIVVTVGNFSVLDFVDKNTFSGDLRRQFFNMAFLTHAAYDFAADARGYAFGALAEIHVDDWALRLARLTPPTEPNQLALDFRVATHYGDQIELEHWHRVGKRAGAVRLLGYRNRETMGRFDEAVAAHRADARKNAAACEGFSYGSTNATAPDLCWVRRANVKVGVGVNVEQELTEDVGVFLRGMVSDGQTEVYSYTSTDRSLSFGTLVGGAPWHRPLDLAGVGAGVGFISKEHAAYLGAGGVDGFIGDGAIRHAPEGVFEVFYSAGLWSSVWLSIDWQHIWTPAFNADRGPVDVLGGRVHAEL
jgi:hypothetical protein